MSEATIHIKEKYSEFPGTRTLGEQMRKDIEQCVQHFEYVIIDMSDVKGISNSAADECFGKLLIFIGPEQFKKKIKFKNLNNLTKAVINFVLSNRMSEIKGNPTHSKSA